MTKIVNRIIIPVIVILWSLSFHLFNIENYQGLVNDPPPFNPKNKYKYSAVIVETKKHKALQFVLENIRDNLSNEWGIVLFHGNKNIDYINNIIAASGKLNDIRLVNINVDNLSISDYNKLLINEHFYNHIDTETILIFQTDSMICPQHKDDINNFLKYDYVGAPWTNNTIGDGGFSLRKKSKMLEIIKKCPYNNESEDVYFSSNKCVKLYMPKFEEAKMFSTQSIYNKDSFGIHSTWKYISDKKKMDEKENHCTGFKNLTDLNK